ncbi:MAG: hypothetical protein ACREH3_08320, partial [Geminicoccales bacterium]
MAHRLPGLLVSTPLGEGAGVRAGWRWPAWPTIGPWLVARLLEERERWVLWLPVGIGTGVALYFALPVEPPPWLGAALLLTVALAGSACGYRMVGASRARAAMLAIGLGAILLG